MNCQQHSVRNTSVSNACVDLTERYASMLADNYTRGEGGMMRVDSVAPPGTHRNPDKCPRHEDVYYKGAVKINLVQDGGDALHQLSAMLGPEYSVGTRWVTAKRRLEIWVFPVEACDMWYDWNEACDRTRMDFLVSRAKRMEVQGRPVTLNDLDINEPQTLLMW